MFSVMISAIGYYHIASAVARFTVMATLRAVAHNASRLSSDSASSAI
jgi:hypothetical protein